MQNIKSEVLDLKKELEEIKEESFATEILRDYKKANKRQFIIILVILGMWFATIGYLVYVLNDIEVSETLETIDIDDVDNIDNSHIEIGDEVWAK